MVFVTTNGTTAIRAVQALGPVLVGALRNVTAAAAEAVALSQERSCDLTIVCAGREGAFGIDDAYCAGALVERILRHGTFEPTDGAGGALRLYRTEPDARVVFTRAAAGQNVIRLGLRRDLDFCAEVDVSKVVPRLSRELRMLDDGRVGL